MLVSGRVTSSQNLHFWVPAVTPPEKLTAWNPKNWWLVDLLPCPKWAISVFQGVRFCFNSEFALAKGTFCWWKKSCTTTGIGGMKSIPKRTASSSYKSGFHFARFHSSFRKPPLPQRCPASHRERGTGGELAMGRDGGTPVKFVRYAPHETPQELPGKSPELSFFATWKIRAYLPKMKVSHLPTTCIFSGASAVGFFTRCMPNLVLGSQWLMDFLVFFVRIQCELEYQLQVYLL